MVNYRTLTDVQLAEVLVTNIKDLEDAKSSNDVTTDVILAAVKSGASVFEVIEYGIAVVHVEGGPRFHPNSVLWLLYIAPLKRGAGIGNNFVKEIREKHERNHPMVLVCNGAKREAFFQACGFHAISGSDGGTVMISVQFAR